MLASGRGVLGVTDFVWAFGALAAASLVPIVWAIADVLRRPSWQFSAARKAMWALTLAIGWLLLWPVALASALVYLTTIRRRFPPATAAGPGTGAPGTGSPATRAASWQPGVPSPPSEPVHRTQLPPAGWYADPAGSGAQRWWDGVGWSDLLR